MTGDFLYGLVLGFAACLIVWGGGAIWRAIKRRRSLPNVDPISEHEGRWQ